VARFNLRPVGRLSLLAVAATLSFALVLAACGGSDPVSYSSKGALGAPSTLPTTTTTTAPDPPYRSFIATARTGLNPVPLYTSPGGSRSPQVVSNPNENKVVATFLVKTKVVHAAGADWSEVYLPIRPNGSTAWVKATDVTITFTDLKVVVGLAEHHLEVLNAGAPYLSFPAGIGTGETPTPGGVFYIKELLKPTNPDGAYGPAAFGLSGFSNVLTNSAQYPNGVIGIHGTNEPDLVGTNVSHGCIRLLNSDVEKLVGLLPLGTPVEIDP
jgi:hypothetical protein